MWMYLALGLIPLTFVTLYFLRGYIWSACFDFFVNTIVKVGTHFYASQDPVKVEKRYMCIPYSYHGIKYRIYVPFSRTLRRKMLNTKAHLVNHDGTTTEISQQPGCCYMITASALGGKEIVVHDNNTRTTHTFSADEIPVLN